MEHLKEKWTPELVAEFNNWKPSKETATDYWLTQLFEMIVAQSERIAVLEKQLKDLSEDYYYNVNIIMGNEE